VRLPVITGLIKRRLLVNYRADPEVVLRQLPAPFRPKLHEGSAVVGICLIRLEGMRPAGLPSFAGLSSENAAHRIAVEWEDELAGLREGVFIPRRDTGSVLNRLAGGRFFPGEHHAARFAVQDDGRRLHLAMESADGLVRVRVAGEAAEGLPPGSCFGSLDEASRYFAGGSLGYSVTRDASRLDGLELRTPSWSVVPFEVSEVFSSYFADASLFPQGAVSFDHALIMRDVAHEWHQAEDFRLPCRADLAA
jgi:Uncharacterized conserved protein (COG2071)